MDTQCDGVLFKRAITQEPNRHSLLLRPLASPDLKTSRIGSRRIDYPIPSSYFHRQLTVLVHLAPFGRIQRHFMTRCHFAVVALAVLVTASPVSAFWGHHRCCDSSYGAYSAGTFSAAAPVAAAPAAAPAAVAAPLYYYAAPLQLQAAAAPAQGVFGISDIMTVLKIIGELRSGLGSLTSQPGTTTSTSDASGALAQLQEGQKDIRGRLINNAGILESIGQKLDSVNQTVGRIENQLGNQGPIMLKLDEITKKIAGPPAHVTIPGQPTGLGALPGASPAAAPPLPSPPIDAAAPPKAPSPPNGKKIK